ncbi:NAD-dependent epimerase/dehydratase family protein [Candidatus Pelagibacter sp.]|nr:NAD-dependent epimerase/dehydratase family protein [Candidatus Pelagibacter sp.]
MNHNLIIGKNSFVGKSLKNKFKGTYISSKEIFDVNFSNYKNIILLSSPEIYKRKKIKKFLFEKKILKKISFQKLIFFSTSKIYPNKIECSENMSCEPQNHYAENKLNLEKLLRKEHKKTLIFRFSNIFDVDIVNKNTFLGQMHKNFFQKNKIIFDINLNSLRDFISMHNVKKVLDNVENKSLYGTFNIGSQTGYKISEIIKFYFGFNALKTTPIYETKILKSQTLSIKKIRKVLSIKKNEFHIETKKQLLKCKKFFF